MDGKTISRAGNREQRQAVVSPRIRILPYADECWRVCARLRGTGGWLAGTSARRTGPGIRLAGAGKEIQKHNESNDHDCGEAENERELRFLNRRPRAALHRVRRGQLHRHGGVNRLLFRLSIGSDVGSKRLDQELNVGVPAGMGYFNAVAVTQIFQTVRKLVRGGHVRTVNEHRDHRNLALQRRGNLQGHKVVGIFEPALAICIRDPGPIWTDDTEQDAAVGYVFVDCVTKVGAGANTGDIHKDVLVSESAGKVVEKSPRLPLRVVTAITDENGVCHASP